MKLITIRAQADLRCRLIESVETIQEREGADWERLGIGDIFRDDGFGINEEHQYFLIVGRWN